MQKKNFIVARVKAAMRRGRLLFKNNPDKLLKKVKGVIHVGQIPGRKENYMLNMDYLSFGLNQFRRYSKDYG